MSHYSTVQTRFVSARHLADALRDLGYEVEAHVEAQPLRGWLDQDQAAQLIVRRESLGTKADLGFRRDGATFELVVDDMEAGRFRGAWMNRLSQRYAVLVTRDVLAQRGMDLVEEKREHDGTVRLVLRRSA